MKLGALGADFGIRLPAGRQGLRNVEFKLQSESFSILIPLPFLRLSLADATRAKNLGSCSNL
jgi:hypothetical protein